MELLGKKIIKLQDAKFKIHNNKNNETSIFIDKDLASKINLIDGFDSTFIINEENLLRALSFLFQFKKQLYKKEKTELDQNWFSKEYDLIKKHFITDNKYTCNVNVSKGRFYLKSLTQESDLNIRNILIENHFELEFLKEDNEIFLNLNYCENELSETSQEITDVQKPVLSDRKLTVFSLSTIIFLIKEFGDVFIKAEVEKFNTKVGQFKHVGYKLPKYFNSGRVFGAFENDNAFKKLFISKERTRYHSINLDILDESNIYFSTEIEYNKAAKSNNLFFGDFKTFIEDYSKGKYSIRKEKDTYELIEINPSFKSTCEQKIFYGSPGTGKSRLIKNKIGNNWPRITFHPELDYQGFVGAYKPSMRPISDVESKEEISYEYVPEAFIKAYCKAWKSKEPYYLIIEEINRGNCAQIFGDIFQLLDRGDEGYSEYPIQCSPDIQRFLRKEFENDFDRKDEYKRIAGSEDFSRMALPNNLNLLATMNTSDQSLFPMDSAFKRRWDWQYVPIEYDDATNLTINVGEGYNWGDFISSVNKQVKEHTQSEDKQLGNRFVSPRNGIITPEQFVSKVLFYLWTEIYKDEQGTGNTIFINSEDDSEILFGDFFECDGKINESILMSFLNYTLPKEQTRTVTEQEAEITGDQSDN